MSTFINPLTQHDTARRQVALGPYAWNSDHLVGGYTYICKFAQPLIAVSGTKIRLTLQGTNHPTSNLTGTISNVTISNASSVAGAKAYDSAASPTAVTFNGGSASVAVSRRSEHVSDDITFEVTGQRPLLIAFNLAASAYLSLVKTESKLHSVLYFKAATAEAGTTTRATGYSAAAGIGAYIRTLEVFS